VARPHEYESHVPSGQPCICDMDTYIFKVDLFTKQAQYEEHTIYIYIYISHVIHTHTKEQSAEREALPAPRR